MGLFKKKQDNQTKCKECGLDLYSTERLERHQKKAHGRAPQKKMEDSGGDTGGMW